MLSYKLAMKMGTWIPPNESLLELINNSHFSLIDSKFQVQMSELESKKTEQVKVLLMFSIPLLFL